MNDRDIEDSCWGERLVFCVSSFVSRDPKGSALNFRSRLRLAAHYRGSVVKQELTVLQQHPEDVCECLLRVVPLGSSAVNVAGVLLQFLRRWIARERSEEERGHTLLGVPAGVIRD